MPSTVPSGAHATALQPVAEAVDGLVVERVHPRRVGAQDRGQPRAGVDADRMGLLPPGRGLAMLDRSGR